MALKPNYKKGEYLAFIGRMSPEKRPDRAIEMAIAAGIPLKMAAKVDKADKEYFETTIKPMMDHPLIEFVGEITEKEKSEFLGNAIATLFPIDWPEPFGLVMIESMACATPVVAYCSGSVPEVIDNGVTGYIVKFQEEAIQAIGKISALSREKVREQFVKRFSAKRMALDYVDLYKQLVAEKNIPGVPVPVFQ